MRVFFRVPHVPRAPFSNAPGLLLAISFASLTALAPLAAQADSPSSGVRVKFDTADIAGSPFPSDRYTQRDWSNRSFRRVNLPTPRMPIFSCGLISKLISLRTRTGPKRVS